MWEYLLVKEVKKNAFAKYSTELFWSTATRKFLTPMTKLSNFSKLNNFSQLGNFSKLSNF